VASIDTTGWTRVIRNATLATCAEGRPFGLIPKGAVAIAGNRIAWVGSKRDVPANLPKGCVDNDVRYALVTPGLIDCHTHLIWAGTRFKEFEQRLQGTSYEEIARGGGGILSTVAATRAASEADLLSGALARASKYVAEGVTTLEIKSGYGLDKDNELKILRVARTLGKRLSINVRTTLLAAHAVPPEFKDRPDDYINSVCDEILPAAHAEGLADAVDAYCDNVGFTAGQVERVFVKAKELGLAVKLHAEQFSNQQGAALAAKYKALSADHLEHLDKDGVQAMAESRTVAVLLPGAYAYLREIKQPPIELLRVHRVPMAIASDLNPGTSPFASLHLQMNLACTLFGLSTEEALLGVTRHAARALGLRKALGSIEPGKVADIVVWNAEHPSELAAQFGLIRPAAVLRAGQA
jgi:imidazolonepropionase